MSLRKIQGQLNIPAIGGVQVANAAVSLYLGRNGACLSVTAVELGVGFLSEIPVWMLVIDVFSKLAGPMPLVRLGEQAMNLILFDIKINPQRAQDEVYQSVLLQSCGVHGLAYKQGSLPSMELIRVTICAGLRDCVLNRPGLVELTLQSIDRQDLSGVCSRVCTICEQEVEALQRRRLRVGAAAQPVACPA